MKLSKHDIKAIGSLVGKDQLKKPAKHMTKEKKDRLFESAYQLYKELQAKSNLKRPGRQYEIGAGEPRAKFIGFQETGDGNRIALFNVLDKNLPQYRSTVTEQTLVKLGIPVPPKVIDDGYTPAGMPKGKCPILSEVNSNPSWVADHDIWMAAKAKAPGAPWGVITNLYKQMGGRIFKKQDFANQVLQKRKQQNYRNRMKTAGVDQ